MSTTPIPWKRPPGAESPIRIAARRVVALLWGTNLRRTLTTLLVVLAAVGAYFLVLGGSAQRLLQAAIVLSVFGVILIKPHVGVIALRVYRAFGRGFNLDYFLRGIGVTLTKTIGLFTFIAFISLVVTKRIKPVFGHKTQLIFIYGLFGSVLISAFAALYWKHVGTHVFQMAQNILLYIIFVNLFAEAKWLSRFMWALIISALLACVSGIVSAALQDVVRAAGTMGNANGLAMVANQTGAMLLVLSLTEKETKKKALFLGALSLCMVTIVLTGSRGGLLTAIVIFAYQLVKRRSNLVPYLAAVLILLAAFAVVPEQYKQRQQQWFGAIFSGEASKAAGGSRGFVYRSALDMFKRSPIIGIGPRTFGVIYREEYGIEKQGPVSRVRVVHSGILEVLVENGILGFAFFLGLIISTYVIFLANGRRCRRAGLNRYLLLNEVFESLYVAIIVSGSFETIVKGNGFFTALAAAASIHRATLILSASQPGDAEAAPAALPQAAPG